MVPTPKEIVRVWIGSNAEIVQKEARFIVDKWDLQVIIKPPRVVINRFRWNPGGQIGLGKKVSDSMVKGFGDEILDLNPDRGFILITGLGPWWRRLGCGCGCGCGCGRV